MSLRGRSLPSSLMRRFRRFKTGQLCPRHPVLNTSPRLRFLGTLFCAAYPRQIVLVCLIVLGGAVLLEIMQLLTPDRHGRIQDAIEKMASGLVGIVVGRAILYFNHASRR